MGSSRALVRQITDFSLADPIADKALTWAALPCCRYQGSCLVARFSSPFASWASPAMRAFFLRRSVVVVRQPGGQDETFMQMVALGTY